MKSGKDEWIEYMTKPGLDALDKRIEAEKTKKRNQPVMANTSKVKIIFLQDFGEKIKKGHETSTSKKEAEDLKREGYVEVMEEPKKESKVEVPKDSAGGIPEKEILKQELSQQRFEDYKANEINWLEGDYWDSWDKVKGHWRKTIRPNSKKEYQLDETPKVDKWFFLAHSNDEIVGKPQLIEGVMKRIPLIRLTAKFLEKPKEKGEMETHKYKVPKYLFFDESYDKRYGGPLLDAFALDFWFYRIISTNGKEYYVFSQNKLPNQNCTFKGMLVEMDDFAEISKSMKIKSLSRIFFAESFEPDVKILTPKQLINFTKSRKINEGDWLDFLAYHELGNCNRFPTDTELLKSAFILSGKEAAWPLHLTVLGPPGTKKSMGFIENTAYKFDEEPVIIEGGDSRIKGLVPSFKEKPANIGYLARQERMGWIDEIGKMIETEGRKNNEGMTNLLGELNFLLDHKQRTVGSGNDNDCRVQASAKFMFVTNPVKNRNTIYEHVGLIDPTTMSRMLWWVQDEEEQRFAFSEESLGELPPTLTQEGIEEKEKEKVVLIMCWRKIRSREEFLTLFDSSNNAISNIDKAEILRIVAGTTALAKEPMKTSVWKPRAFHHVFLLVDGLVKHRCLFKDYNPDFTAIQEDYDIAERILMRMVQSWSTNLAPKDMWDSNRRTL